MKQLVDVNKLVSQSDLNQLIEAKKSINDRLMELEGGYYQTRTLMKQERAVLKDANKKIQRRITQLTSIPKE